jgi:hypothetical protein
MFSTLTCAICDLSNSKESQIKREKIVLLVHPIAAQDPHHTLSRPPIYKNTNFLGRI